MTVAFKPDVPQTCKLDANQANNKGTRNLKQRPRSEAQSHPDIARRETRQQKNCEKNILHNLEKTKQKSQRPDASPKKDNKHVIKIPENTQTWVENRKKICFYYLLTRFTRPAADRMITWRVVPRWMLISRLQVTTKLLRFYHQRCPAKTQIYWIFNRGVLFEDAHSYVYQIMLW